MLNADSSTLKSESDVQSRPTRADDPERRRVFWIARTVWTMLEIELPGNARFSSRHEVARLVGRPASAEQRERQEEQRHEREQREVGDHRREVRAAVGEELARAAGAATASARSMCLLASSAMPQAADALAHLTEISTADRGRGRARPRGRPCRPRPSTTSARGRIAPRQRSSCSAQAEAAARAGARRSSTRRSPAAVSSSSADERAPDRGDDRARADGRARLLRPEERPAQLRRAEAEAQAEAEARAGEARDDDAEEGRCEHVGRWPSARRSARLPARCCCAGAPARSRDRVELYFDDGSLVTFAAGLARGRAPAAARARAARGGPRLVDRAELGAALARRTPTSRATSCSARAGARATTSTSTASRRVPELLGPLGELIAETVREHEPDAVRLAGARARRRRAGGCGLARLAACRS